ncbi:hypothetical protein EDB80DRAFT_717712 [Ilyonectria destructans]|nr:hypothetical protein EDB80DRAFT_717712 [Ilyonectria destructans]
MWPNKAASKRACDVCRRRKIKCDGEAPICSTCDAASMPCCYAEAPKKRGPKTSGIRARRAGAQGRTGDRSGALFAPSPLASSPMSIASPPTEGHERSLLAAASTASSSSPQGVETPKRAAAQIYDALILQVGATGEGRGFGNIIVECVRRHMQNSYLYGPLYHEPSVLGLAKFLSREAAIPGQLATCDLLRVDCWEDLIGNVRDITLIMAVCARIALGAPRDRQPVPGCLGAHFLHSTEEMLKVFEKWDIEHAAASSLTIRILLASTYHTIGRRSLSSHFHCQARLMAVDLRLYSEAVISRYGPLEAQLLRMNFWLLYRSERAIAILNNQPVLIQPAMLDGEIDVALTGQHQVSLLDPVQKHNTPEFEERLFISYDLYRQVWTHALDFMLAVRYHGQKRSDNNNNNNNAHGADRLDELTRLYFAFIGGLDDLPTWLQNPNAVTGEDEEISSHHRRCFWAQRANLTLSFHCIKMVMVCWCIDTKVTACMGLSDQPAMLNMKKTEIAGEFLHELALVPFEALQLNGEPCVEKLRRVGAVLLEVTQAPGSPSVLARCKGYLARLLDILARLDSRASDELGRESGA